MQYQQGANNGNNKLFQLYVKVASFVTSDYGDQSFPMCFSLTVVI